jgi:hypothetical protein
MYGGLLCVTVGVYLIFNDSFFGAIVLFAFGGAFGLAPFGFMGSFVCENQTTLEDINDSRVHLYDRGCWDNSWEACGYRSLWFLPLRPPVTGFYWCGKEFEAQVREMMQIRDLRNGR